MDDRYEQEIDLKDLIFYILHKWRPILLYALVLLFLFGGYKATTLFLEQQNEEYIATLQEEYNENMEEYRNSKEGYESSIITLTNNIEYEEKYQKDSVLFNIDPNSKWVATADVFVQMKENTNSTLITVDPADSLVKAYESAIINGSFLDELSAKTGIDVPYLKELISVEADNDGNMFLISTTNKEEAGTQEILNAILNALDSIFMEVSNGLGEHSIVIMNQNIGMIVDQDLADSQKQRVEDLETMRLKLKENQIALDGLQEPSGLFSTSIVKTVVKYGILGAIIGGFITVLIYCMKYIMSSKLYSSDELQKRFNLKIFGVFMKEKRKRAFSGVDNFFDKLEGKEYSSREVIYQRVAANIVNYTINGQNILLTGTIEEEAMTNVADKLKEMLPEIQFEIGIDMNKNPQTLTKLLKVDGIVLIEECGISKYDDIQKELETIYSLNQKVIGCIVL